MTDKIPPELLAKKLCQLHPEIGSTLVVAMVLSKTEPNIFLSKNDTQYKGVINFTLRDTEKDIVNCKFWGTREKVEEYNVVIKIGDIIDVICPKVTATSAKAVDSKQPRYQPVATLPFALILNEGQGFLQKHSYHDLERYAEIKQLRHQSHKPLYSVLNLSDVKATYTDVKCQMHHTDFLVVVGLLRTPREIRSGKEGRVRHCLELVVFDQSLSSGLILTIWHEEWIQRAQQFWQPMKTVLHLIDVKVSYSEFYKACVLAFTSRSLIYENPKGQETKSLQEYAGSIPKSPYDMFAQTSADSLPKADEIKTVMTVRQLYTRAEGQLRDNSEQFTAVVYAMITRFDLEWQGLVVSKRCKSCNHLISKNKTMCDLDQCQLSFSFNDNTDKFEYFFNTNVHLTDQTGTIAEARLTDAIATRILGLTCAEYFKLDDKKLEKLKWSFLLNHFEVKLLVKKPNMLRRKMVIMIIDMRAIDLEELAKNIAVF